MSSTGSSSVTFGRARRAARSCSLVPQVGTAANATSGKASASARKMSMPLTAQGFASVTNSFANRPSAGQSPGFHQGDRDVHRGDPGSARGSSRATYWLTPTTRVARGACARCLASLGNAQSGPNGTARVARAR